MDLLATLNSIKTLSAKVDRVILFHSGAGKDSICLLNMMSPFFKEIVCVYMYFVKDLEHMNKYIRHAEKKYPNCRFIQTPHYAYYNNKKNGMHGTEAIAYSEWNLSKINDKIKEETGIEWSVLGFKKNDSLNRRLMLNTYPDSMTSEKGQKLYPLSDWSNKEVLQYIRKNRLIEPIKYGNTGNTKSQGNDVNDISFLLWMRQNYPNDLKKLSKNFRIVKEGYLNMITIKKIKNMLSKKEIWKGISGYENMYEVSNFGNVKSLDRKVLKGHYFISRKGQDLKVHIDKYGYEFVQLRKSENGKSKKENIKIHRLVAQAFINNPLDKQYVNHINGVKTDNTCSNLEWCTSSENNKHAYKIGLKKIRKGEAQSGSKFTYQQAEMIRKDFNPEVDTFLGFARKYNVSDFTISRIIKRQSYAEQD